MVTVDKDVFAVLQQCDYGKWFLERGYGLELLCILLVEGEVEGVERLYSALRSPVPKRPAFYDYLNKLEAAGCVERYINSAKRSRKGVRLSTSCRQTISQYLRVLDSYSDTPPPRGFPLKGDDVGKPISVGADFLSVCSRWHRHYNSGTRFFAAALCHNLPLPVIT